jgi:hypothetical protein
LDVPPSTPFKTNTAGEDVPTTLAELNPKLRVELDGCLWQTTNDSFFGQFFPPLDDVPLHSTPFPNSPTEAAVVQWFKEYNERYHSHLPAACPWVWQTSPTRPLVHPQTPKRKVDLFLSSKSAAKPPVDKEHTKARWADVVVVGELKNQKGLSDLDPNLVIQISNYVRETFGTQPGRRYVHAFTIVNATMRCWMFTRSGGVASQSFDLDTQTGLDLFRRVIVGYMRMTPHKIGLSNFSGDLTVGVHHLQLAQPNVGSSSYHHPCNNLLDC